jgi:hypothetical protein
MGRVAQSLKIHYPLVRLIVKTSDNSGRMVEKKTEPQGSWGRPIQKPIREDANLFLWVFR